MEEGTLKILSKMTRTKLIEEAKNYPDIVGAHGLTKEQLIEVLSKAKKEAGEWVEESEESAPAERVNVVVDRTSLKKEIKELKRKRNESLAAGDREAFQKARARLNRVKGRLRRLPVTHHHTH